MTYIRVLKSDRVCAPRLERGTPICPVNMLGRCPASRNYSNASTFIWTENNWDCSSTIPGGHTERAARSCFLIAVAP